MRRVLLWSLAVVITLAGATWAALTLHDQATYGSELTETTRTPTLNQGDRFSLAVPDRGASVGDSWTAAVAPDGIVTATGNRKVMSNVWDRIFGPAMGGGAGTRYFTFTADNPGAATVTLSNCFQGCHDDYTRGVSRTVSWTITVGQRGPR